MSLPNINQDQKNVQVLKFVNDSHIKKKQLKIKAFNLFHLCQNQCLKDIRSKDTDLCFRRCEQDLDQFHEYKKKQGNEELKKVYWGIPTDKQTMANLGLTEEDRINYQKKILDAKIMWVDYLKNVENYLQNMQQNYTK